MGQHLHRANHAFFFFLLIPKAFLIKTMSNERCINEMLDPKLVHLNVCFDKPNRTSSEEQYGLDPSKNTFIFGNRDFMKHFVFIDEKVPTSPVHFIHQILFEENTLPIALHSYPASVFRQSVEGKAAEQPHRMAYANRLTKAMWPFFHRTFRGSRCPHTIAEGTRSEDKIFGDPPGGGRKISDRPLPDFTLTSRNIQG
jgi:hypothetical protein